jgi:hypothetical protein
MVIKDKLVENENKEAVIGHLDHKKKLISEIIMKVLTENQTNIKIIREF